MDRIKPSRGVQTDLEWLLHPISVETFLTEYWEQKPLYIPRDDPEYYSGLLSLQGLDEVLGRTLTNDGVRTAKGGAASGVGLKGDDKTSLCELYDLYYQGHTIVIQEVHLRWQPIDALGSSLARELGCIIGTHLYPTPQGYQGFGTHWDEHDIFALQLEGEKEWSLYAGPALPRYSVGRRDYLRQPVENPGEPFALITMKAGDLLYFPKGIVHRVRSTTRASLHLTYGLYPETWERLVIEAFKAQAEEHPALQKALPIGLLSGSGMAQAEEQFARLLATAAQCLGWEQAFQQLAAHVTGRIRPQPDGHFARLAAPREITGESAWQRRDGMLGALVVTPDKIELHFPGGQHSAAPAMHAALRFICDTERFRVRDLPGGGGDAAHQDLVRALAGKGFLKPATP